MSEPTQTRKPWNAVARTVAATTAALSPLLPLLPEITTTIGAWRTGALGAGILGVAALVTRLLAIPGVNEWLRRHVPILSAQGKTGA